MGGTQVPGTAPPSDNVKVFATMTSTTFAIQIVNYDTAQSYSEPVNVTPPNGGSIGGSLNTWQVGSTASTPVTGTLTPGGTLTIPPATVFILTGTL